MDRIQCLMLLAVLAEFSAAERQFFLQSNVSTWDQARLHCQTCYKELVSLTFDNIQQLVNELQLGNASWIGLRKNLDNASLSWTRWSNGDPVIFQNWYPGRPILSKPKDPVVNIMNYYTLSPSPSTCGCCCNPPVVTIPSTSYSPSDFSPSDFSPSDFSPSDNDTYYNVTASFANASFANASFATTPLATTPLATTRMTAATTTTTQRASTAVATSDVTTATTFFSAVTNSTGTGANDTYVEDPCIVLLSCGLWYDKVCSQRLPFICYEDRFYGNASISNRTTDTATLNWTPGPGDIASYRVEVKATDYTLTKIHSVRNDTDLIYSLANLTAGTQYQIQVFPVKCDRDLNPGNVSFYTKPDLIKDLKITNISETMVSLSWSPPHGHCDFYSVKVNETTVKVSLTNNTNKDLIPGTFYRFDVNAEVEDHSISGDPQNTSCYTKPGKVKTLIVSNFTNETVLFQWDPPFGNTSGYRVTFTGITNGTINTPSAFYLVSGMEAGSSVNLSVVALVSDGSVEGEASYVTGRTKPGSVVNLQLSPDTTYINVSWGAPGGTYEDFNVTLNSSSNTVSNVTKNTNCTFTGLKAGVQYTVTVLTRNGNVTSEPVARSIFTRATSPTSLKVTNVNHSEISVVWEAPADSQDVSLTYKVDISSHFNNCVQITSTVVQNTTNRNYTFTTLSPGMKYNISVAVRAGSETGPSVSISTTTLSNNVMLMVYMDCSSSVSLQCEDDGNKTKFLDQLKNHFTNFLADNITWSVTLK